MKIRSIRIRNHQQFKNTYFDFKNPSGEACEKVCFIGTNGTGKSTLLSLITDLISRMTNPKVGEWPTNKRWEFPDCITEFEINNQSVYYLHMGLLDRLAKGNAGIFLKPNFEYSKDFVDQWLSVTDVDQFQFLWDNKLKHFAILDQNLTDLRNADTFFKQETGLLVYSPAESINNKYLEVEKLPHAELNTSLALFKEYPYQHIVSHESVSKFWVQLMYLLKKREAEQAEFDNYPQNLDKTRRQLNAEFNEANPKILIQLQEYWNLILNKAGLEFDALNAKSPSQLNDNLEAFVRIISTKEYIAYNKLSTGIRNYIFRIGHILSLFFNRQVSSGFLLIDEPENSLFPDFLFDMVSTYESVLLDKNNKRNSQLFISTHSPIIAAQFENFQRNILYWSDGIVKCSKGQAPIGDDPNDLLTRDFGLPRVMGEQGQQMWSEYLRLKRELRETQDPKKKQDLAVTIKQIGDEYNFPANDSLK